MFVTCIKSNPDFTKGRQYKIVSHKKRGVIAVKNDFFLTHTILNLNPTFNITKHFFNDLFTMDKIVENAYTGSIEPLGH